MDNKKKNWFTKLVDRIKYTIKVFKNYKLVQESYDTRKSDFTILVDDDAEILHESLFLSDARKLELDNLVNELDFSHRGPAVTMAQLSKHLTSQVQHQNELFYLAQRVTLRGCQADLALQGVIISI